MTPLLPELEGFPVHGVFDGELVAFNEGQCDFDLLCDRMLLRRRPDVPLVLLVFDVLRLAGEDTMRLPWRKRRQLLDELNLSGAGWHVPPWFEDGQALWQVVIDQELEGAVAKPLASRYVPGQRGWTKVKNRGYWKHPLEVEAVRRRVAAKSSARMPVDE